MRRQTQTPMHDYRIGNIDKKRPLGVDVITMGLVK